MQLSKYWPKGLPWHVSVPETSLYYNLEVSANRYPDKAALIYYGTTLTWSQYREQVDKVAAFLQQRCGVRHGDRVVLFMQNSPQFMIAYYAILRANAAVVPVNPMNLSEELRHIARDSGATVALVSDELYRQVAPLVGDEFRHVVLARYADYVTEPTDLPLPAVITNPPPEVGTVPEGATVTSWRDVLAAGLEPSAHIAKPADLAVIPYTSGTTGNPKGCMHTHRSVMFSIAASGQWSRMSKDGVALGTVPMFHVTGMQNCLNLPVLNGSTVVVMTRWDSRCAAHLIERYRVSAWVAVPPMLIDFMSQPDLDQYDLSSMATLSGGGAAMPAAVAQRIETRWGIPYMEGYGLSETIAATHINPPDHCKPQCCGIPMPDTVSIVVDPATMKPLPVGETGEILTSGPQVFEGYWGKPDATREAFVEIDGRKFLRTGDLGYIDEDGYFFIVDRLKRMVNASGYKVWPAEVEALMFAHPAVQEACVIGAYDEKRGETVKAFVVRRAGFDDVTEQQIVEWAHEHMASYKAPRIVEFMDALPRSGTGKVQWRRLQEEENARRG